MNDILLSREESPNLRDSTLSARQWFEPPASALQVEQDHLHRTWRTQQQKSSECVGHAPLIRIPGPLPVWLPQVVDQLNSILALKENWDSYGSHRMKPETAIAAIYVLDSVMLEDTPIPSIVPTPSGNIQAEWHIFGIDLEVEITRSGNYSVSYEDETEQSEPYEDDVLSHSIHGSSPLPDFVNRITHRANKEKQQAYG